jgi:hypothetical protein
MTIRQIITPGTYVATLLSIEGHTGKSGNPYTKLSFAPVEQIDGMTADMHLPVYVFGSIENTAAWRRVVGQTFRLRVYNRTLTHSDMVVNDIRIVA